MTDVFWLLLTIAAVVIMLVLSMRRGYRHGVLDAMYSPRSPMVLKVLEEEHDRNSSLL